ncbi:MAG: ACT domain-containing protein [Planctomycetota bacterium]|nr:ACT domain-containing protein [Planctomycetota bacterium]
MPVVKQLSVFLANKPGVMARLCRSLAQQKINLQGLSVSDTVDHAVIRMITSNPAKARVLLESAGVLVIETDVLALSLPDRPGELGRVAATLAKAKVNIEYAYGTTGNPSALMILRVSDIAKARKALKLR